MAQDLRLGCPFIRGRPDNSMMGRVLLYGWLAISACYTIAARISR
jgi:hypothetical protein